ncbi:uncharacterized protein LOC141655735 [Silene latifolia]|uniref:uncharacterized protein LOC141655735 n=1 Tax=Silene latifolia TaxID=37657 RepID=UPI003D76F681
MPRRKDAKELQAGRPFFVIGKQAQCRGTRVKVDASWERNLDAACGWVAYNGRGVEIHRGRRKLKAESALQAEALGLREVFAWARDRGELHLKVTTDCLRLVNQIAGLEKESHVVRGILSDLKSIWVYFHCVSFSFVPRHLNNIAHGLARQAMKM